MGNHGGAFDGTAELSRHISADHIIHNIIRNFHCICIIWCLVGALSSVALFRCNFSIGKFFGIIRVYTVLFSDP